MLKADLSFIDNTEKTSKLQPVSFIPARLLKLGRPPQEKKQMPDRQVPALQTAPPDSIAVSTEMNPPEQKTEQKERPASAIEDEIWRQAQARARAYAEIQDKINEEGSPDGVEYGTETDPAKVTAGNLYATYLYKIFRERWTIPTLIDENSQKSLKCQVFIKINPSLRITDSIITKSSGNRLFDDSVLASIQKVDAEVQHLRQPPEIIKEYIFQYGIQMNFYGNDAQREE